MKTINFLFVLTLCIGFSCKDDENPDPEPIDITALSGVYLGQTPPGNTPKLFVPDILKSNENWWWHARADFQNDGKEFFMDIYCPSEGGIRIRFMKIVNEYWTAPSSSPFSSNFTDGSPSFTNNGNKVFFLSDRPNGIGYGIWTSVKNDGSWSTPQPVTIPVNSSIGQGWEISVTNDETIYSRMEVIGGPNREDIYVIKKINGLYNAPERLDNNINSSYSEWGVFVDPEGEYMLFSSDRPGGFGEHDIYISFKNNDGTWNQAVNLGASINSNAMDMAPSVSSDKKYLFFKSYRLGDGDPFWIEAKIIEELRPNE
jgi:hypothetical protein